MASDLNVFQKDQALKSILYSLKSEIERELSENSLDKCLIDTSLYLYITMNKQKKHIGDISLNQYVPFLAKPYFGSDLTTIIYLILYQKSTSVP